VTTAWSNGLIAQVALSTPLRQAENVTTRVAATPGLNTVLHQTATLYPSMLEIWEGELFPQQ
jgi:hypothetical protein